MLLPQRLGRETHLPVSQPAPRTHWQVPQPGLSSSSTREGWALPRAPTCRCCPFALEARLKAHELRAQGPSPGLSHNEHQQQFQL